jgi:CBS domain-containing protein
METTKPILGREAEDLMSRDVVAIPRRMPMRDAARLLRHAKATSAPVVDEMGRCVGVLSPEDLLRWAKKEGRIPACHYQAKGLVPESPEAVTCTLAEGSCQLQVMRPTSGGRRVVLCRDPNCFCSESQLGGGEPERGGDSDLYMTKDVVTAKLRTPLSELARMMIDAHANSIVVVDDDGRPAGVVSSTDLLGLMPCEVPREAEPRPAGVGARLP